jgi:acyl-coenzyme A thioesterase PaaI-like protein
MKIKNPNYPSRVREIFDRAAFIADLGIQLRDIGPGWCETELLVLPKHLQQDTYVHAGELIPPSPAIEALWRDYHFPI